MTATDTASTLSVDADHGDTRRKRRRQRHRLVERLTPALIVGVLAALVTFVVIAGLLRDRRETTSVVVVARPLVTGDQISSADVDVVDVPSDVAFADELVTRDAVEAGGLYAGRVLRPGEPVTRSATAEAPGGDERRTMALPLADWGVAGGELEVGDEIDVIDVAGDEARYIVQRAAVVARSRGDTGGGLGGQRGEWVSIEVTEAQALEVAAVVEADAFVLVRSGSGS